MAFVTLRAFEPVITLFQAVITPGALGHHEHVAAQAAARRAAAICLAGVRSGPARTADSCAIDLVAKQRTGA